MYQRVGDGRNRIANLHLSVWKIDIFSPIQCKLPGGGGLSVFLPFVIADM